MATRTIEYLGYMIEMEACFRDSRYHESQSTIARIIDPETGSVVHAVKTASRSGHQLKKNHRPAQDTSEATLHDAQRWVRDHCPRAKSLYQEAQEREAAAIREAKCRRYQELGEDPIAYILSLTETVNATTLARILGFKSVRAANKYLLEWNIQTRNHGAYLPVDPTHGRCIGKFTQLFWNVRGLKAAWDAGVIRGVFSGGDHGFVERIRATTRWLDF